MAKIVIENYKFDFDLGCRLLKLKHTDCPFPQLEDFWDDIKPLTFKEIAQLENLEMRRIGIVCLGLERLVAEVNPNRLSRQTITKKTNWVNEDGSLIESVCLRTIFDILNHDRFCSLQISQDNW